MSPATHHFTQQQEALLQTAVAWVRERLLQEPRYGRTELRRRAQELAGMYFRERLLPQAESAPLVAAVTWEIAGFGPLEPLLADEQITDIVVNGAEAVLVRRGAGYERTEVQFQSEHHLREIVDRIVEPLGRRLDESNPYVDGRLPDGHRIHAIIPPLARGGTHLSIRLFRRRRWSLPELAAAGAISPELLTFFRVAVQGAAAIVVSGSTGAGKTTLLGALAALVPPEERLVVVEDSGELVIDHPHVVCLETRAPNAEGRGGVPLLDLVRQALRMAPTRILVGEVRGVEALAMLDAINTGHRGSLATVHANSPAQALDRLAALVARAQPGLPIEAIRMQMMGCLDLVVQVTHCRDGQRRVTAVAEVVPGHDRALTLRPVFTWQGAFQVTATPPRSWPEWAAAAGVSPDRPPAGGTWISPDWPPAGRTGAGATGTSAAGAGATGTGGIAR